MKKRIKRIAQKSNRKLQVMTGRMEVNLMLPIAEVLTATQWHIEQLAGAAGMKIIEQIIKTMFGSWLGSSVTRGMERKDSFGDVPSHQIRNKREEFLS